MPFDPENFFRNLAEYPELLKIINDLTMNYETQEATLGGKDDLLDLIDQIKKRKFDCGIWQERLKEQNDVKKIRAKWLSFYVGFSGDEDLKHLKISWDLNSATVETYKIMGRKFSQLLKQIPAQDQEEIRAGLVRYVFLIAKQIRINCICGKEYYADDAVNMDDKIRCPYCNTQFPFSS